MRPMLHLIAVVILCSSALASAAQDAGMDMRLVDGQAAFDEATKLKGEGKYVDALSKADRALALWEAALGPTHPDVARCLSLAGSLHILQGDYAGAEPILQRALGIQEQAPDKTGLDGAI